MNMTVVSTAIYLGWIASERAKKPEPRRGDEANNHQAEDHPAEIK
jgi:hypothetical protein